MLALYVFGGLGLAELLLYTSLLWRVRRPLAAGLAIAVPGMSGLLLTQLPVSVGMLVLLVSFYRCFNMLRLVESRLQPIYLRRVGLRTSVHLFLYQLGLGGLWWLSEQLMISAHDFWLGLAGLQLLAALLLLITTLRHSKQVRASLAMHAVADRDLPSISVCVPARNETAALENCLQSLVASNYPKLEILVLDDCSQDKTSEVIRSFAQAGIRFVKGSEPPADWLAKNWAYQQLSEAASGEILVFAGVDVQFAPDSLRSFITGMISSQRQMICLLPQNYLQSGLNGYLSTLLQPMRYAWELSLPRSRRRPPVLSTCWAITRKALRKAGGFAAATRTITPESYFARACSQTNAYDFRTANERLNILSDKSISEQWSTAVRTRYPQLHRRPQMVFVISLAQLSLLIAALPLALTALWQHSWMLVVVSGLAYVLQAWSYAAVVALDYRRSLIRGWLTFFFATLLDVYIRNYSMWRYEFGEVLWKGRNVCLPVMRLVPKLPKL